MGSTKYGKLAPSQRRKSMKRKMQQMRSAKNNQGREGNDLPTEDAGNLPPLIVETVNEPTSWNDLSGNRIFTPGFVLPAVLHLQSSHTRKCTAGTLQFKKEVRSGLHCKWIVECDMCHREYEIENEKHGKSDFNSAGAWAALSSRVGFSQLENILSVLNVPFICYNTFSKEELDIDKVLKDHLEASMKEAGEEELAQAIKNGDVDDDGVPFITVVVDGGWAKRSYGHNYNSSSGVAVIIGQHTGKLLFLGVRNKYCCICERATKDQKPAKHHLCYKNWDSSKPSTGMEQAIIVEGFCHSVQMHGVKYKYFVGDGDSSVYARIMQKVPYGRSVLKMECANHCVRNYTGHLHTLAADKTFPPNVRKLLKPVIPRLTAAARGAIRHCGDSREGVDDLVKDLRNGPNHVFGDHAKCREYFCDRSSEGKNVVADLTQSGLFEQIQSLVERLVAKASRLKENKTSNAAENYMSLVAKFCGAKRINYTQRGSFQLRCRMAALRFQKGLAWEKSPFKKMTGKSPGSMHKKVIGRKIRHQNVTRRKLVYQEGSCGNRKRYLQKTKLDSDYGPSAEQVVDIQTSQLSEDELQHKCENYISSLQVNLQERDSIVEETKMQADCEKWHEMRRVRLTASNFGIVCRRESSTPSANLVKKLLYKPPITTPATEYGRRNEHIAIQRFKSQTGLTVKKCGLVLDLEYGFLGASPDGFVPEENAVIEVKCVPSAIDHGLKEAAARKKNFFLHLVDGVNLVLKRTHPHYYQLQGAINIMKCDFGYFVVMTDACQDLHIEKVPRDEKMWETEMLPKLTQFYRSCLLPEIVDPVMHKGAALRGPVYILEAQKRLVVKQKIKRQKNAELLTDTELIQDV